MRNLKFRCLAKIYVMIRCIASSWSQDNKKYIIFNEIVSIEFDHQNPKRK